MIFLFFFLARAQLCCSVILNMECGDSRLHCPGDLQYFTCAITSNFLQWESPIFPDIEFYDSPIGTIITNKEFSANVSNKTGSSYVISVLTFPTISTLTGVAIVCRDVSDGYYETCIINATYPNFTVPSNLEASPMSYSSVLLHWESNSINKFGFLHYNVNIKPPSIAGNCTKGSCNVKFLTEVYLVNIKPLTPYIFTVRVVSCVGIGSESRNLTFSITAYKPLLPNKLNVCTIYNMTSQTDAAYVNWHFSQIVDDFHPIPLYFVLQIVNYNGETAHYNISQSDYIYVPVTQGEIYNISLTSVNIVGKSDNSSTKSIEITSSVSVETDFIGSDFAVLHITVQWSEPCGSLLDITVVYNVKNTTLNSTIKYQYNLISDKNGSIVVLRELEVDSVYEYQVFVYNTTTLVIKPVNGIFKTLNNITIPDQSHTSLALNSIKHYTTQPWTDGTISGLTTEPYTTQQTKWIHESSTFITQGTISSTYNDHTTHLLQILTSGIFFSLVSLASVIVMSCVLTIFGCSCYIWRKRRRDHHVQIAMRTISATNVLDIKDNDAYCMVKRSNHYENIYFGQI